MRILFAVSNSEDSKGDIVDVICNEYQKEYKKIISYKRAFYYDAIVNEIKQTRDNKYDRIIITEDLEKNIDDSYESEDFNLYKHHPLYRIELNSSMIYDIINNTDTYSYEKKNKPVIKD